MKLCRKGGSKSTLRYEKSSGFGSYPAGGGEGKVSGKNGAFGTWKEALVGWFVNRS